MKLPLSEILSPADYIFFIVHRQLGLLCAKEFILKRDGAALLNPPTMELSLQIVAVQTRQDNEELFLLVH